MNALFLIICIIVLGLLMVGSFVFLAFKIRSKKSAQTAQRNAEEQKSALMRELEDLRVQLEGIRAKEAEVREDEKVKANVELTLKKALKRAEEESFQKNTFLSNLSSEIRTPLNNIIGFASLLEHEISLL